jgi:hypothetical protein
MCDCNDQRPLDFETLLSDPMTRLVMQSDGVSMGELVRVLEKAGDAVASRQPLFNRFSGNARLHPATEFFA